MTVRPGSDADAEGVLALMRAMPELPQWSREALACGDPQRNGAGEPMRRLHVAEDGGKLLGFAQFVIVLDQAELECIAVGPAWQRRGVGRVLLQRAAEAARADGAAVLLLEVRRGNESALRLYRSVGFRVTGTRRGYYSGPVEDALLLQLSWA